MAVVILTRGIVTLLTLPGVIIYGWENRQLTRFVKKRIQTDVTDYVMPGIMGGQVVREEPQDLEWVFLVPVVLFILNTIIAMALFIMTYINYPDLNCLQLITFWFGFSLAVQSFPLDDDYVDLMWEWYRKSWRSNMMTMIGYPVAIVISLVKIHWLIPVFYAGIILIIIKWIVTGTFT